jgi:hypothetical protein
MNFMKLSLFFTAIDALLPSLVMLGSTQRIHDIAKHVLILQPIRVVSSRLGFNPNRIRVPCWW